MAAISAFCVTQHSQVFSFFFRNRIQCIALYQLHNSQALLNLRRDHFTYHKVPSLWYHHTMSTHIVEVTKCSQHTLTSIVGGKQLSIQSKEYRDQDSNMGYCGHNAMY